MYLGSLDGKVTITRNKYLCCSEIISLQLQCTKDNITLYYLPNKKNIFIRIPSSNIVAINKRQIDKNDLHKFSIFYYNTNNNIKEIKLKAVNRSEMNNWIINLNKIYKQKEYKPNVGKSYELIEKIINPLYSNKKKDVFVSLALIEYIILSKYEISFMNKMKEISKAVNYKKTNRQKNYNYYNAIDSSFRSEQSSSYLTKH